MMLRESLSDTTLESRLTYIRLNHTAAYTRTRYLYVVRVTKVLDNDIPVLHGTWAGHHPNNRTPNSPPSIKPACAVNRRPTTSPPRPPHPPHPTHPTSPHPPASPPQALRTRKASQRAESTKRALTSCSSAADSASPAPLRDLYS